MRTLINNLIFRTIIIVLIPCQLFAQLNEKFYNVSDAGELQFTYWESVEGAKSAIHPVTSRTFFLEGKRNGVIPQSMSYPEFLNLSTEELQAIITNSQQDVIAAINQKQEDISSPLTKDMFADAINEQAETDDLLNYIDEQETIDEETFTEEQEEEEDTYNSDLPWIIQAVTNPTDNCKVPVYEARVANRGYDKSYDAAPWIVQALIGHDDLATYERSISPVKEVVNQNTAERRKAKTSTERLYVEAAADEDGKVNRFLIDANYTGDLSRRELLAELNYQANNTERAIETADKEVAVAVNPMPAVDESHIRAMVYNLVNGLMAEFNDDRSSDQFGHVFPGIDGKLYGTSDGELNEIVEVLLTMKEAIIGENNDYVQLFNELEAWASAR